LLCAILGVLVSLVVTTFFLEDRYESYLKLYVYTPSVSGEQAVVQDMNAINLARRVVNTYIEMLNTRSFYQQISEDTGLRIQPANIRFSVLADTEVFQATVNSGAPEDAMAIAQSIASIAPRVIQDIYETASLKIVDPPRLNTDPVSPNLRMNLAIGLLAGLMIAGLFVFLRDLLDTKIKDAEQLTQRYGVHVLAEVGDINAEDRRIARPSIIPEEEPIVASEHMEAYRTARTNLIFSVFKKGCKKIAVASSVSMEGKTLTSVNIAVALSKQLDIRVLLIDCDLRKPRVHRLFKTENVPGLSDYLCDMCSLDDIVQKVEFENLNVICSGTIPPNPSELIASSVFVNFLEDMEKLYDYIIIDTSPLVLVADALSIVRLVDGVILTAVAGVSIHPVFSKTLEMIKNMDAKVAGVILHGVEKGKRGYKYKYKYEYYAGYAQST
jgi:capsular exopolysaccharide synthesis family protein